MALCSHEDRDINHTSLATANNKCVQLNGISRFAIDIQHYYFGNNEATNTNMLINQNFTDVTTSLATEAGVIVAPIFVCELIVKVRG